MPTYTMELWRVIEMKPDNVSEDTWLGLNDYPIFEPSYRDQLNKKIKNHFMYQEIGHETVEQFTFRMRVLMNEIMPLYNQLYKSQLAEFDPLVTVDILNTSNGTQDQTSTGSTTNGSTSDIDAKSKNIASSFPQVPLSPNKDYATSGADANSQTKTTAEVNETAEGQNTTTSETESRTKGYQGSPAQLIQAARSIMLNIDLMIINDVDVLFMSVWNNTDEYTQTGRFV